MYVIITLIHLFPKQYGFYKKLLLRILKIRISWGHGYNILNKMKCQRVPKFLRCNFSLGGIGRRSSWPHNFWMLSLKLAALFGSPLNGGCHSLSRQLRRFNSPLSVPMFQAYSQFDSLKIIQPSSLIVFFIFTLVLITFDISYCSRMFNLVCELPRNIISQSLNWIRLLSISGVVSICMWGGAFSREGITRALASISYRQTPWSYRNISDTFLIVSANT